MNLNDLGFNRYFKKQITTNTNSELRPARVMKYSSSRYVVFDGSSSFVAKLKGSFRYQINDRLDLPVVGDWVMVLKTPEMTHGLIHRLLKRQTAFIRKSAGKTSQNQVIAANIDVVFLVSALDEDFNIRRLERYLTLCWNSRMDPVIVLNKIDISEYPDEMFNDVATIAMNIPIFVISAKTGKNMVSLHAYCQPGKTITLLGSSGVGKSSIINSLIGTEHLKTSAVRESDHRGCHTTTQGQLVILPSGGMLIDTPGLREIQLSAESSSVSNTFKDIGDLAIQCRFRNCTHTNEPGCAVKRAIEEKQLEPSRLKSYQKLLREEKHIQIRQSIGKEQAEKSKWKSLARAKRSNDKYICRKNVLF